MILIKNISKTFIRDNSDVHAVHPVTIEIVRGQSYALVGESGSGKTTLCNMLAGLSEPDEGEILLDGENIYKMKDMRNLYRNVQLVMQNSKSAFNPTMSVKSIIGEPLKYLMRMDKNQIQKRVIQLLEQVELSAEYLNRKPHELSGGQQKRVAIARAIGINPKLIIFDEAVSGLDVTVKNKILYLLKKLQKELDCSYFFIAHDIAAAFYIADHILIMKDGEIVERCDNKNKVALKHEYSRLLINSATVEI